MYVAQYFGKIRWGAAVDELDLMVPVPVGMICLDCKEPIAENDSGTLIPHSDGVTGSIQAHHRECFLRSIVGSVAHQNGTCSCCGGTDGEDTMTKRQAAIAACKNAGIVLF